MYIYIYILPLTLHAVGEWYNGDVKTMVDEALAKGGDPNVSDAYTINGRTGFPNGCSDGRKDVYQYINSFIMN